MTRRSAEPARPGRVAVVGASTVEGTRVRKALERLGVPGPNVDLFGTTHGEALLGEYDGEARLIQEPDVAEIGEHRVIFLCETSVLSARLAVAAAERSAILDLVDGLPDRVARRPLPDEIEDDGGLVGCFTVPHGLSLLLAEVLGPLEQRFGLAEAAAVILRPASDFGERAVEELREQTVKLLSFAEVPVETFGRQLAFNVIPESRLPSTEAGVEGRIAAEAARLLNQAEPRIAVRLLTVPLFYGHGLQLRVRLERGASLDEVRAELGTAGQVGNGTEEAPATPLEVTGEAQTSLADVAEDGLGGFWIWGVAGEIAARGARHAVRLAARIGHF